MTEEEIKVIPFSPPRMDQAIIDEVVDTLQSGWITTGPKTKKLELMLTEFAGHRKSLCVSSGSAGLELMLRWYGVGEGDEVILPAYTYAATANVIIHVGAKPVFVDVGTDFNIDADEIRQKITSRTKVIMPVDIGGFPADYDAINSIVNEKEIKAKFKPNNIHQINLGRVLVISDAAHSLGAYYKGKRAGSLTDITVFSFHAVKNLTTAEGGAVCLNLPENFDVEEIYKELNLKSLHGQNKDALAKSQIGNWRYDIVEAGYKYNMTDISASMGLVELQRYDSDMLVKRKYIFDRYAKELSKYPWAQIPTYETDDKTSSYHVFMLRIRNVSEVMRDQIIQRIFGRKVTVNVHFIPLPMMSYYRKNGYSIAEFPNAFSEYAREISLPVYYDLTDEQITRVINAVIGAVEEVFAQKGR
jgi:dTDP-4-amino-4,6-dideoxygalactose transaminase